MATKTIVSRIEAGCGDLGQTHLLQLWYYPFLFCFSTGGFRRAPCGTSHLALLERELPLIGDFNEGMPVGATENAREIVEMEHCLITIRALECPNCH